MIRRSDESRFVNEIPQGTTEPGPGIDDHCGVKVVKIMLLYGMSRRYRHR